MVCPGGAGRVRVAGPRAGTSGLVGRQRRVLRRRRGDVESQREHDSREPKLSSLREEKKRRRREPRPRGKDFSLRDPGRLVSARSVTHLRRMPRLVACLGASDDWNHPHCRDPRLSNLRAQTQGIKTSCFLPSFLARRAVSAGCLWCAGMPRRRLGKGTSHGAGEIVSFASPWYINGAPPGWRWCMQDGCRAGVASGAQNIEQAPV